MPTLRVCRGAVGSVVIFGKGEGGGNSLFLVTGNKRPHRTRRRLSKNAFVIRDGKIY